MSNWKPEYDDLLRRHCRLLPPGSPIEPDALLVTLGVDSLEIVEMIIAIEDEFDLTVPQEMLTPEVFETPATIWRAIEELAVR